MLNLFSQNHSCRTSLATFLTATILFLAGGWVLFYPQPAQAVYIVSDPIHTAKTIYQSIKDAAKWAWEKVKWAWEKVHAAIESAKSYIRTAHDIWHQVDTMLSRAARIAAQIALHTVLNMLTNDIVNWIQNGQKPRFISNWRGFLKDVVDKAGGLFIDKYLGAGWLCEPFDMDIKIALLNTPSFDERVSCTISDIVENISDFYNDFRTGDWTGWIELTKPQNNFHGALLMAQAKKLAVEEAAKDIANQEGATGKGFLSIKVCVKGYLKRISKHVKTKKVDSCSDKDSCQALKDKAAADPAKYAFYCEEEKTSTPGSVLEGVTNRALDRQLDTLSRQIADLTDSLGPYAPYVIAVGNALINRLIKEGLGAMGITGPSSASPDEPLPPGQPIEITEIETPAQAITNSKTATFLLEAQKLLKENLESQLLVQQQSNLDVMESIKTIQINILKTLILNEKANCPLPDWASSQIISSTTEPGSKPGDKDKTIEIIRISASDVGNALIKRTSWPGGKNKYGYTLAYYTYETLEINPQISSQIASLQDDIAKTKQRITDTATAIASTNGFIKAVDEYVALYDETLKPPTEEEQVALDEKKKAVNIALELLMTDGRKAAQSSADNLSDLVADTQKANIIVNQQVNNLLTARGLIEDSPEPGTLYAQKANLEKLYSSAQSHLNSFKVSEEEEEKYSKYFKKYNK